jgi:NADH-quinone oxidoreductase subunit G
VPNRRGVEEVLRHFGRRRLDEVLRDAVEGRVSALYLTAGYPPRPWMPLGDEAAKALGKVSLLVVQDLFATPVSAAAKYVIPAAAFAEKDGTFVNHAGLAQSLKWVVQPTGEVRTEGQVFLDLMERRGLLKAVAVRAEMAAEIPAFAPWPRADLGEYGIRLESRA